MDEAGVWYNNFNKEPDALDHQKYPLRGVF